MINKINNIIGIVTNKYLIEVCFLEQQGADKIPVGKEHRYIITDNDGNIVDYTTDPTKATCFSFLLGCLITKALIKVAKKECPNLSVSMVSVVDADFIYNVYGK